ncbi:MAG TPA: MFS transporter, partial [bacterium]|nr:MFS transporter [bacterium]
MTPALAFHLLTAVVAVIIAVIVVVYIKGLRASPRDLWLLYGTKVLEYSAYAMINMTIVLYLTKNFGMGDVAAGTYFSVWSILINFFTIVIGAVTDTIGIKRTLLLGTITLVITRFILALSGDIYTATVFGFMPYAFGLAVMAPVISVGIKKMTTKETAAMGFALFYTLMNVGYAIGGWLWDKIRIGVAAGGGSWTVPGLGAALAPYEAIFFAGFLLTLPSLLFLSLLRDGVELDDKGQVVFKPQPKLPGGIFTVAKNTAVNALTGTAKSLKSTWSDPFFYKFLLIIFIVVFVRLVFFHLNSMTLPKYGLRLFGPGAKIGALYGVLNPVLVVILVPLVGYFFKKVPSYRMLLIGTTVSALACFIGVMPGAWFEGLNGTLLSGIVFTEWLGVAGDPHPAYWPLLIF